MKVISNPAAATVGGTAMNSNFAAAGRGSAFADTEQPSVMNSKQPALGNISPLAEEDERSTSSSAKTKQINALKAQLEQLDGRLEYSISELQSDVNTRFADLGESFGGSATVTGSGPGAPRRPSTKRG